MFLHVVLSVILETGSSAGVLKNIYVFTDYPGDMKNTWYIAC